MGRIVGQRRYTGVRRGGRGSGHSLYLFGTGVYSSLPKVGVEVIEPCLVRSQRTRHLLPIPWKVYL